VLTLGEFLSTSLIYEGTQTPTPLRKENIMFYIRA
jgi:hypothetical protein